MWWPGKVLPKPFTRLSCIGWCRARPFVGSLLTQATAHCCNSDLLLWASCACFHCVSVLFCSVLPGACRTQVYEDATGRTEKPSLHDMLLPHEIMASLYQAGKFKMLVGEGTVACLLSYLPVCVECTQPKLLIQGTHGVLGCPEEHAMVCRASSATGTLAERYPQATIRD